MHSWLFALISTTRGIFQLLRPWYIELILPFHEILYNSFSNPCEKSKLSHRLSACPSTPDSFSLEGRTSYQCHSSSPAFQLIPHSIPRPCYKLILAMAENFSGVYLVYGRTSIVQHTNQDSSFNPYPGFTLLPFNPRVRRHAGDRIKTLDNSI